MITEAYLNEVQARIEALVGLTVEIVSGPDGGVRLEASVGHRQFDLQVMRDLAPAASGDVKFVGYAFTDVPRLLDVARSEGSLPREEVNEIAARLASASPGPWTAFIETDGGLGGCDVIHVSEDDDEPDMYLWAGPDLASSAIFRFVAAARQDIPTLLAAIR